LPVVNKLSILGVPRWLVLVVSIGFCTSCTTKSALAFPEMQTCLENAAPTDVRASAFSLALRQAQQFSEHVYGADCFVCAQVFDNGDTYMLHITSPIEDMYINTSAAITVRKSDGHLSAQRVWHGCHARITKKVNGEASSALAPAK
jgi:tRNA U54 and U55 pseudouridine synthase Pus10